jgi:uncharacterized circularly permuted ATP-grasp superfamily protein
VPPAQLGTNYESNGFYDEMLAPSGKPRPAYRRIYDHLNSLGPGELKRRHDLALEMFRNHGITFAVYPDEQGIEKVFPSTSSARHLSGHMEAPGGRPQTAYQALNHFLEDVYTERS